jgi:hypothetical protein
MTTFKWQVGDDVRRLAAEAFDFDSLVSNAAESHVELQSTPKVIQITCLASDLPSPPTYVAEDDTSLKSAVASLERLGARSIKFVIKISDKDKDEEWDVIGEEFLPEDRPDSERKASTGANSDEDIEVIHHSESEPAVAPSVDAPPSVVESEPVPVATIEQNSVQFSHPNWLNSKTPKEEERHEEKQLIVSDAQFHCTICEEPIFGVRYKCFFCTSPAVNLCQTCDTRNTALVSKYASVPSSPESKSIQPDRHIEPLHDANHPFIRVLHSKQCPDTGVVSRTQRKARANPFGISVLNNIGVSPGSFVSLRERFFAGWKLRNDSGKDWVGWKLKFIRGVDLRVDRSDVGLPEVVAPGHSVDILLEMEGPWVPPASSARGIRGCYRFALPTGALVGPPLEYEIRITPGSSEEKHVVAVSDEQAFPPLSVAPKPAADPQPSEEESYQFAMFRNELQALLSMGFSDRERNLALLKEGRSVEQIIEFLLKE